MTLRDLIKLIDNRVVEDTTEAKGIYRLTSVTVYDNMDNEKVYTDTIGGLTFTCMKRLKDAVRAQILTDYLNDKGWDDYSLEVEGKKMKLDPRIKDRKYIFDCFNADEAKEYIGKKCYMTDYFERFEDVESTAKCTLRKIDEDGFFTDGEDDLRFTYCLPMELVAPKEKKYRPYTFPEFCEKFLIGSPIKFRQKGDVGNELYLILEGYRNTDNLTFVYIGSFSYTLDELFNKYEWQSAYTEDFEPFGVEE